MHHLVILNARIVWGAVGTISTIKSVVEKQTGAERNRAAPAGEYTQIFL